MPGKPPRRGAIGAAANRDGSRSDPELDAAVFTVLTAGRGDGLSALAGLADAGSSLPKPITFFYHNRIAKSIKLAPSFGRRCRLAAISRGTDRQATALSERYFRGTLPRPTKSFSSIPIDLHG